MSKRLVLAAFIAAVALQVLILLAIPARRLVTLARGRTIVLKVQPIDPYSILSGYYVTLGYTISRLDAFPPLLGMMEGDECYAVVEKGANGTWQAVAIERSLPTKLSGDKAVIKGTVEYGQRIRYGIEDFYIPEARRTEIADDLRKNFDKAVVDVKVDDSGHAVLERLRIEDRVYQ